MGECLGGITLEFSILVKYRSGARAFERTPDPYKVAEGLCRSCGVELKEVKLTFGSVHLMLFCEAPEVQRISKLVGFWEDREDVQIQVLMVLSRDEYLRLLSYTPSAAVG
jgi:uncharacterized protein with GYD domain